MSGNPSLTADTDRPLRVEYLLPGQRLAAAMNGSIPTCPGASRLAFNRVLRVALALRGGVSLAVWIGGAVAELDILRRIRIVQRPEGELAAFVLHPVSRIPTPAYQQRVSQYARLLADAGYDEVQFDVLAGASAGGLNSVLYGVAQRAGTGLDEVLDFWRDSGGMGNLLQQPGRERVEAPLRGDTYFWPEATRAVDNLYKAGGDPARHHDDLRVDRLSVHLAATVIDGEGETEPEIREGRGHFIFRVDPDANTDLPNGVPAWGSTPDDCEAAENQLLRLAYAARATSSLPGGFEVARITSPPQGRQQVRVQGKRYTAVAKMAIAEAADGKEAGSASVYTRRDLRPDFSFAFSAHRGSCPSHGGGDGAREETRAGASPGASRDSADPMPYEVIDGGTFDNIPIDRALRAAKETVAPSHGDRALLYLDPDPEGLTVPGPRQRRGSAPLWSVFSAYLRRRQRRESAGDELDEVHHYNGHLLSEEGRLESLIGVVPTLDTTSSSSEGRQKAYLENLAAADARFLIEVVSRPSVWQLTSPLAGRDRFSAISVQSLREVRLEMPRRYSGSSGSLEDKIKRRPSALMDASNAVLRWVRSLERSEEDPGRHEVLREVRKHITSARGEARLARDTAALRVLRLSSQYGDSQPIEPVSRSMAVEWVEAWCSGGDAGENEREGLEERRLREHHQILDRDIECLRDMCRNPASSGRRHGSQGRKSACAFAPVPGSGIWLAIHEKYETALTTLDLVAVVAPSGMEPPMSFIHTATISGNEEPADPKWFPWVVDEELRIAIQDWIDDRPSMAEDLSLTARGKLAGQGLGNFPGFLSAEWRTNDWWWGRLDAAAGLTRFLASRACEPDEAGNIRKAVTVVQDALMQEVQFPEQRLDRAAGTDSAQGTRASPLRAGADSIWNLTSAYRTAIATRALSALLRSAAPRTSLRWLASALTFILRPALLLVPALVSPTRIAVALGAFGGLVWLISHSPLPYPPTWLRLLAFLAGALLIVLAVLGLTRRRARRWRNLRPGDLRLPEQLLPEEEEMLDNAQGWRSVAARYSNVAGVAAASAGGMTLYSIVVGNVFTAATWILILVGYAWFAIYLRGRVPPTNVDISWVTVIGSLFIFIVLGVVGPILGAALLTPSTNLLPPASPLPELAVLAGLVGLATVISLALLRGWGPVLPGVLALGAGSAAWVLISLPALVPVEAEWWSWAISAVPWLPGLAFLLVWANTLWFGVTSAASELPEDRPARRAGVRSSTWAKTDRVAGSECDDPATQAEAGRVADHQ